jgi:hypothetical protein
MAEPGAGIGLFDDEDFPPLEPYVPAGLRPEDPANDDDPLLWAADDEFRVIPRDVDEEISYDGISPDLAASFEGVTLAASGAYMFQEMDLALVDTFLDGATNSDEKRERAIALLKAASAWIFGDILDRIGSGGVAPEVAFQLFPQLRDERVPLYTYGDALARDPLVRIPGRGYCLREDLIEIFAPEDRLVVVTRWGRTTWIRRSDKSFGPPKDGYCLVEAPSPALFLWVAASSGYVLLWPGVGDVTLSLANDSFWLIGLLQYYGLSLLAVIAEVMRWPNQIMFMIYARHFLTYMVDTDGNPFVGADDDTEPQAPWDRDIFDIAVDPRVAAARTGYPSIIALIDAIYADPDV